MKTKAESLFSNPRVVLLPLDRPSQPSFHNENPNVISFSCRAGLKNEIGTYKETTRLLGIFSPNDGK